jgi:type I restriction enzyme S subunit
LNQDILSHVPANAPPVPEQRAIGGILGALDDKIELNRRMNETLEAMARALFKSWFIDFDPVHANAEGRDPGLPADIAALFPDSFEDFDLGEMPRGWRVGTLEDYAELNSESWSADNVPNEVNYVDLANVKWGRIEATQRLSWKEAPSRARRIVRPGDTIVGTVRPGNGSYSLIAEDGLTGSTGFAVLRPRATTCAALVYLTATEYDNIVRLAHLADGAAYPAVRPEDVLETQVVLPDRPVVECFARCTRYLMERQAANDAESRTLTSLRETLLPRLLSGELRVKGIDELAEAHV